MRKLLLATAAGAAALAALPAAAQDGPFTGLRAEALVGYDNLQDGGDGVDDGGRDGVAYGGAIGYDVQMGGVIVGAEAELTGSSIRARSRDILETNDRLRLKAGRDIYVGGRVGFLVSPLAMVYAKAGYTNAAVEARYDLGNVRVTDQSELDGFRVGGGLEYQMSPRTYVKGEYRYSNYSEIEGFDADVDRHQVMAGVGFRF